MVLKHELFILASYLFVLLCCNDYQHCQISSPRWRPSLYLPCIMCTILIYLADIRHTICRGRHVRIILIRNQLEDRNIWSKFPFLSQNAFFLECDPSNHAPSVEGSVWLPTVPPIMSSDSPDPEFYWRFSVEWHSEGLIGNNKPRSFLGQSRTSFSSPALSSRRLSSIFFMNALYYRTSYM